MFTLTPSPLSQFLFDDIFHQAFWRAVLCEFVGTAILVFVGCGSIVLQPLDNKTTASDIIRTAFAFGFAVNCLIKTFAPISGCHINPVVSISFMLIGKVSPIRAGFYSIAQLTGGTVGAALLYAITPCSEQDLPCKKLGITTLRNGMKVSEGFGAEAILTFVLLIAISACLDDTQADYGKMKITNPMTIGFTVTAIHLVGIPYTGSSLNPARTFGPALVTQNWSNHWVYWIGPLSGACLATVLYHFVMSPQYHYRLPILPIVQKRASKDTKKLVPEEDRQERKSIIVNKNTPAESTVVFTAPLDSSMLHAVIVNSNSGSSSNSGGGGVEVPIESYNNQRWNRRRSTMKPPSSSIAAKALHEQDEEPPITRGAERRNTIHTE